MTASIDARTALDPRAPWHSEIDKLPFALSFPPKGTSVFGFIKYNLILPNYLFPIAAL